MKKQTICKNCGHDKLVHGKKGNCNGGTRVNGTYQCCPCQKFEPRQMKTKPLTIYYAETQYGFDYGSAKITRCASDDKKGWVVIAIDTPKCVLQVYVTRTGKIRVYSKRIEWKPITKIVRAKKARGE